MSKGLRGAAGLVAVLAIGAVVLGLAGCAENRVDQESLESSLVETAQGAAPDVESASCPDDVSSDKGTEFECTVVSKGEEIPVVAEIITEGDEDVEFEVLEIDGVDITP